MLEQNPLETMFEMYIKIFSQGFCSTTKIVTAQLFPTPPYFCGQLAFYRHLPTSGKQNTVKTAPQPLIVNSAFVALYVGIILPIGPILISLFVFELEAEEEKNQFFTNFCLASRSSQSEVMPIFVRRKMLFLGVRFLLANHSLLSGTSETFSYTKNMLNMCPRYPKNIPKISPRYPEKMPKTCSRYARGMPKICQRYVKDMPKICPSNKIDGWEGWESVWPKYPDKHFPDKTAELVPLNKMSHKISWPNAFLTKRPFQKQAPGSKSHQQEHSQSYWSRESDSKISAFKVAHWLTTTNSSNNKL